METNSKQNIQKKEIGKIEGVIYLTDTSINPQTSDGQPKNTSLPFPDAGLPSQPQPRQMYHKERTQDILVHCPQSLHRRMTDLKNHLWDEYGERVTINNMAVEAIALWLDQKAPLSTTATDRQHQQ